MSITNLCEFDPPEWIQLKLRAFSKNFWWVLLMNVKQCEGVGNGACAFNEINIRMTTSMSCVLYIRCYHTPYPTTWRMPLPLSVVIFPPNNVLIIPIISCGSRYSLLLSQYTQSKVGYGYSTTLKMVYKRSSYKSQYCYQK